MLGSMISGDTRIAIAGMPSGVYQSHSTSVHKKGDILAVTASIAKGILHCIGSSFILLENGTYW